METKISDLLPIGDMGDQIAHELAQFLQDDVIRTYKRKMLDVISYPMTIRIIAAFASYEKTGDIEEFRNSLRRHKC